MTDDIDAMTPEQLRVAVAVEIFGWRWMKYPAPNMRDGRKLTGLFPPDAPGRWPVHNHYYRIWEPSDEHAPRFSDWMDFTWYENEGEIRNKGLPDYPNEIAAAWTLTVRLRKRGYVHVIEWHGVPEKPEGFSECVIAPNIHAIGETAQIAICRAALRAVRSAKP